MQYKAEFRESLVRQCDSITENRAFASSSAASAANDYVFGLQMLRFLEGQIDRTKLQRIYDKVLKDVPVLFCIAAD